MGILKLKSLTEENMKRQFKEYDKEIIEFALPRFIIYRDEVRSNNIGVPIEYAKYGADSIDELYKDLDFIIFCMEKYLELLKHTGPMSKSQLFEKREVIDGMKDFGRLLVTAFF